MNIRQDARHAMRGLRRNPAFAATAVITLALAIGGNTAMFTVIRAVLLKPLAYRNPDSLVHIAGGATPLRFTEMRTAADSIADVGAFTGEENVTLAGGGEPEVLKGVHVSANFLRILGVEPLRGRGFLPQEDTAGGAPVAMISAALWQRRFGGDPLISGRTANLAGTSYTIVGVLPPRFEFPSAGLDVWMTAPLEWPLIPPKSRALSPFLAVFGRLRQGVSLRQADAEMKVLRRQYAAANPAMLDAKPKTPLEVTPMKDELVANVRSMLWMLFGALGFVLLIACANVGGLLLVRGAARSREFAIRAAVGAARTRLIAQLLVESILLSSCGGLAGVVLAALLLRTMSGATALYVPRATEIGLDWTVFAFAAAVSIAAGVLLGLAPSIGASRLDLIRVLRGGGESSAPGAPGGRFAGVNLRSLLSVGQVAMSTVLLIGAVLLMESVAHLRGLDLGFNPANLLTARISLPPLRYDSDQKLSRFFEDLTVRVASLPGVHGAAAAMSLPMTAFPGIPIQDAARPPLRLNERPIAKFFPVTPGYFRTFGIPFRRGRDFTERDTKSAQRVAIVDETLARRFWPAYPAGPDPVGQRLLVGGVNRKPAEIIGIVANVRQSLENNIWPDSVYVSFAQSPEPFAILAVRTSGNPLSFSRAVRDEVRALDPDQPIADVQTMDDLVEAEVGQRVLLVKLLGSFAVVALLLALIGLYGVTAYSVSQRTQEMGIRRALGAQQGDILWLVIGQGFLLALSGVAAGLAVALALTRVMKSLLFHVSATDPAAFAGVALVFLLVAVAASYIPARRATRIDPTAALRV